MGALQLVAGHFGLALDSARLSAAASPGLEIFYASLALIATGVGFLKTNASTLVGALSERDDPRRDAGFTLFYMGYNTGRVIAPLVCVIGHARSTIVDTIYAHTVESALAGVSERVADRVGLTLPKPPAAPDPPNAPRQPPKLRMIDGGRRREGIDQRDIRQTIDDARARASESAQVLDSNGGADGSLEGPVSY